MEGGGGFFNTTPPPPPQSDTGWHGSASGKVSSLEVEIISLHFRVFQDMLLFSHHCPIAPLPIARLHIFIYRHIQLINH